MEEAEVAEVPAEIETQTDPVVDIHATEEPIDVYVPTEPDVALTPVPKEEPTPHTPDLPGEHDDDKKDA
jgi:hypothetical protein